MKYLKKFETIDFNDIFSLNGSRAKREELKDFCELYLAYLMDDCIKELKIGKPQLLQTDKYVCYNVEIYFNKSVHWDKIKDHFLPFLQMVQKEYSFREDINGKFCNINWRIGDMSVSIPESYTLEELFDENLKTVQYYALGKSVGNVGSIKLDILEEVSKD